MLSLFFPRSIRHFPNCRRKQTKTEILFSYLIIFEVNNRFVAFSIDKNFQKSTEIGSQFHNLPPACSSVSPASSLSFSLRPPLPACSPAVSLPPCPHASAVSARCPSTASSFSRSVLPPPLNRRFLRFGLYIRRGLRPASPNFAFPAPAGRLPQPASSPRRVLQPAPTRFFPLFLLATASPCLFPGCFSPAVSSCFRSFRPLPLNRVFLLPQRPAAAYQPPLSPLSFSLRLCPACLPSIPQSAPFSLSSRRPTYTAVFLTRLPFPITFLSPYPPAAYLASLPSVSLLPRPYSSEVTAAASQPLLSSLRRPFRRSFSLSDKLFAIKKRRAESTSFPSGIFLQPAFQFRSKNIRLATEYILPDSEDSPPPPNQRPDQYAAAGKHNLPLMFRRQKQAPQFNFRRAFVRTIRQSGSHNRRLCAKVFHTICRFNRIVMPSKLAKTAHPAEQTLQQRIQFGLAAGFKKRFDGSQFSSVQITFAGRGFLQFSLTDKQISR